MMRRLYLQIYLTIVAILVITVVAAGLLWTLLGRDQINEAVFDVAEKLAEIALPPATAPEKDQRAAIDTLGRKLDIQISLYDRQGRLVGAYGQVQALPSQSGSFHGWRRGHGRIWSLVLADGRSLIVDPGFRRTGRPLVNLLLLLGSVALGVGLGAYPFVRRLTRRLERLQHGVERIGSGDFSTRVAVDGRDEVARLAESFNEAAARIEDLVGAHRLLLANASHELRTPLSRIRLGVEMLDKSDDSVRRAALRQDIAELDALIDEILLMSRLDAGSCADLSQSVDLVALVAEECARRKDCTLSGSAPEIKGDPRLLRRLVSNLLENARTHGRPPVEAIVSAFPDRVTLVISDRGDGIAAEDRERVFRPFYRAPERQNVKGYGLGLPLVRQIAETHGGTARVLPDADLRSAIEVVFPTGAVVGRK